MTAHDPQRAAADPSRSAWVSANAGAGKTHTLANRVTRLLLAGAKPERILCLTYTKAAAAEMAGRLFDQLGKWAMAPDDALTAFIEDIGADALTGEELRKARRLFALGLETPGGLKIQTIHSFCQQLLARFPLEANVPPSFDVLDEQTARELIARARATALQRAGSGDALLAAAVAYLVTQTNETRLQQILDAALGTDSRKLERALADLGDSNWTKGLRRSHGTDEDKSETDIILAFCEDLKAEIGQIEAVIEWLESGGASDRKRANALRRALTLDLTLESFDAFAEAFLTGKGEAYASLATKGLSAKRPDLLEYLQRLSDRLIAAEQQRRSAHAAALCDAAVTLAHTVRELYTAEKRARGALDYDDLINASRRLLERHDAAAWVLYKLDGGLDHILVDEAQDTSPEQWAILRKLTEEFFAGSGSRANRALERTVFAVGDEKQSIFSFQGADPVQFDINRHYFEERVKTSGHGFAYEQLTTSRRSAPQILTFVDEVFRDPEARAGLTFEGMEITHTPLRDNAKGRVEFWPSLKPPAEPEPDPWRPVDTISEASSVSRLAKRLAHQIRDWIGHTTLPRHSEPVRAGDILILLPRREPFGSEIIRQLKMLNVPVAGADRIKLTEHIAVMDLIALGRFALLPEDDLTLATILRSPLIALSEEELFALCAHREGTLWRSLAAHRTETAFRRAHDFLSKMLARADYAPPYEFYAEMLVANGGRTKMLSRLGAEAADAIDEFLSLALGFEALNTPSLEGFLHWIERGGAEIKRDMERARDEVRVMTVHGAKGLEADIVILPDTTRPPGGAAGKGNLLYTDDGVLFPVSDAQAPPSVKAAKARAKQEALKEHWRLLYVALTRAKDRLYVCGFENKRGVDAQSWYALAEQAAKSIGRPIQRGEETIYILGADDEASDAKSATTATSECEIPIWARTMPREEVQAPHLIRPSDVESETPAFSPTGGSKGFRRGLLIHAMLARLPDIEPVARHAIALKFLQARGIDVGDAEMLARETLRVLDDSLFAPAFAPGSRAEVPLVADLPELEAGAKINGRIDRLAITDDTVLAVDFKTNRAPPEREDEIPSAYIAQMALYRAALRKIFPAKQIVCGLVWTDGPRLVRLDDALLDARILRMKS